MRIRSIVRIDEILICCVLLFMYYVNVLNLLVQLPRIRSYIQKRLLTSIQLFNVIFRNLGVVSFVEDWGEFLAFFSDHQTEINSTSTQQVQSSNMTVPSAVEHVLLCVYACAERTPQVNSIAVILG